MIQSDPTLPTTRRLLEQFVELEKALSVTKLELQRRATGDNELNQYVSIDWSAVRRNFNRREA